MLPFIVEVIYSYASDNNWSRTTVLNKRQYFHREKL